VVPDGPVRVVDFLPRTVFRILGIIIATAIVLEVIWIARHVLTWIFIALFLALALNPAVDRLERRIKRRGISTGIVYLAALGAVVGIGLLFIPTLVNQVNDFAGKVPDYLNDLT
jgi:predicted PurR-regulated permease PerM